MRRLYHAALLACGLVAAATGLESSYQVGTLGRLIAEPRETLDPLPKLMGLDCEGSHGIIYADEESDFPRCKEIRRTNYEDND